MYSRLNSDAKRFVFILFYSICGIYFLIFYSEQVLNAISEVFTGFFVSKESLPKEFSDLLPRIPALPTGSFEIEIRVGSPEYLILLSPHPISLFILLSLEFFISKFQRATRS